MSRPKLVREYPKEVIWLMKHKPVLSFNKIEEKLHLPQSCLWNLYKKRAGLNEEYWPRIIKFVKELTEV